MFAYTNTMEFIGDNLDNILDVIMNKELPEGSMDHFKTLKTDEERFLYAWQQPSVQNRIQPEPDYNAKSSTEAAHHRSQGNAAFQKKSYMPALEEYNKSIRLAPPKKQELALAYGNRSATLMHVKKFELSVRDTDLALEDGYPEELQYKLYDRRGKCFVQLKRTSEASENFLKASECLSAAKLDDATREKWAQTIKKQIAKLNNDTQQGNVENGIGGKNIPTVKGEHNTIFPNASAAIDIAWDDTRGRHALTSRDVTVGDVLVAEKPFASVLFPKFYSTHCYYCFSRVLAPIPCSQCSTVVFCSKQCQQSSWQSVHQYECLCMALLDNTWCGSLGHLVVRIAMVAGWRHLLEYMSGVKTGEITSGEKELQGIEPASGVYASDYHSIHNLVTSEKQRTPEGLFDFTVFSVYLLRVLELAKFLPSGDDVLTEKRLSTLGGTLLRQLQIVQCNANGIREIQHPSDFEKPTPADIGFALYPTASLLNHSCDANADFVYYDASLVLRATRCIQKGEEVVVDYGPSFVDSPLRDRFLALKSRYSFDCRCHACEANWPKWKDLDATFPTFKCEHCGSRLPDQENLIKKSKVKCKTCRVTVDLAEVVETLQESHDRYGQGMQDALNADPENALPKLAQHLVLLQKHARMPWRDTISCQQALRNCYRLLGNTRL